MTTSKATRFAVQAPYLWCCTTCSIPLRSWKFETLLKTLTSRSPKLAQPPNRFGLWSCAWSLAQERRNSLTNTGSWFPQYWSSSHKFYPTLPPMSPCSYGLVWDQTVRSESWQEIWPSHESTVTGGTSCSRRLKSGPQFTQLISTKTHSWKWVTITTLKRYAYTDCSPVVMCPPSLSVTMMEYKKVTLATLLCLAEPGSSSIPHFKATDFQRM